MPTSEPDCETCWSMRHFFRDGKHRLCAWCRGAVAAPVPRPTYAVSRSNKARRPSAAVASSHSKSMRIALGGGT